MIYTLFLKIFLTFLFYLRYERILFCQWKAQNALKKTLILELFLVNNANTSTLRYNDCTQGNVMCAGEIWQFLYIFSCIQTILLKKYFGSNRFNFLQRSIMNDVSCQLLSRNHIFIVHTGSLLCVVFWICQYLTISLFILFLRAVIFWTMFQYPTRQFYCTCQTDVSLSFSGIVS